MVKWVYNEWMNGRDESVWGNEWGSICEWMGERQAY